MRAPEDMRRKAKALGDPTRFRVFRYISDAPHPVGVSDLTEFLGFNHNAVRQHLARLVDAGLVTESTEQRTVRGRPRKQYSARRDAMSAFRMAAGSYEQLASLLLELNATNRDPYTVGYDAARDSDANTSIDGQAPERSSTSIMRSLIEQLAIEGFEPIALDENAVSLANCPFAEVASQAPGVICEIHRGLIDGFLSHTDESLSIALTPHNPHDAGCQVLVHSVTAATD